jgi:hypothetical protein
MAGDYVKIDPKTSQEGTLLWGSRRMHDSAMRKVWLVKNIRGFSIDLTFIRKPNRQSALWSVYNDTPYITLDMRQVVLYPCDKKGNSLL